MSSFETLSLVLICLAFLALGGTLVIMQRHNLKTMREVSEITNRTVAESLRVSAVSQRLTTDLLNRMQAQDLPTYQAMTWQHNSGLNADAGPQSDPYISRSDEAEAAIIAGNSVGIGFPVYDEDTELQQTLDEMMGRAE